MESRRSVRWGRVPRDRTRSPQREEPHSTPVRLHVDVACRQHHDGNLLSRDPRCFRVWTRIPARRPHNHLLQPPLYDPSRLILHVWPQARSPPTDPFPVLVLSLLPKLLPNHSQLDRLCRVEYHQLYHRCFDSQSGERRQSAEDSQRGRDRHHCHFDARSQFYWVQICARLREILVDPHVDHILHRLGTLRQVFRFRFLGGRSDQRHGCRRFKFCLCRRRVWVGLEFARSRLHRQLP
jgi:hypothetical protein